MSQIEGPKILFVNFVHGLWEFVGTMFFIYVGCMSSGNSVLTVALAHGLAIACLVSSFGGVSGGHFNPAITLSFIISGKVGIIKGTYYIFMQLLGSLLGALLFIGSLGYQNYEALNGGVTIYATNFNLGNVFITEYTLTLLFLSVIHFTASYFEAKNPTTPLIIGLTLSTCILAGGRVSGASLNPARTFGPAAIYSAFFGFNWWTQWIYYVSTLLAGTTIGLAYRIFA